MSFLAAGDRFRHLDVAATKGAVATEPIVDDVLQPELLPGDETVIQSGVRWRNVNDAAVVMHRCS